MSAPNPGRKRMAILFGVIFLVHLGAIFVFSERAIPQPNTPRPSPNISMTPGISPSLPLPISILERHPMFFVLPNEHNFSSEAWVHFQTPSYEAPVFQDQPAFLREAPQEFALSRNNTKIPELNLFSTPSISQPPIYIPPTTPIRTNSTFRIEGLPRELLRAPEPPPVVHQDAIGNTTVEIGVDNFGTVVSARVPISGKSSLPAADALAVRLASQMVFAPSDDKLQWGHVIFSWHATAEPLQK